MYCGVSGSGTSYRSIHLSLFVEGRGFYGTLVAHADQLILKRPLLRRVRIMIIISVAILAQALWLKPCGRGSALSRCAAGRSRRRLPLGERASPAPLQPSMELFSPGEDVEHTLFGAGCAYLLLGACVALWRHGRSAWSGGLVRWLQRCLTVPLRRARGTLETGPQKPK